MAIEADTSLPSKRLIRIFDAIEGRAGLARHAAGTPVPGSRGQVFVCWCRENGVFIDYIQPGKPNQNALIECFNRSLRNEVLDLTCYATSPRCERSSISGGGYATKTGRMTRWVACHTSSMHNVTWKTLLLNCQLDWEAYGLVRGTNYASAIYNWSGMTVTSKFLGAKKKKPPV